MELGLGFVLVTLKWLEYFISDYVNCYYFDSCISLVGFNNYDNKINIWIVSNKKMDNK